MQNTIGHDSVAGARWEVHGPTEGAPVLEAWADDYIPLQPRTAWQRELRGEIRSRSRLLEPSADEVLHATFFGARPLRSDVENLLLYNIDESFKEAGRNGIRFEHGAGTPRSAPSGAEYPFCFRYALAQRSGTFAGWQQRRKLGSFTWTDLGEFDHRKHVLAQVWLALARGFDAGGVRPHFPEIEAGRAFAVRVGVRPPRGYTPAWGELLKGIFDGVISAFHAHTDTKDLPEITDRLANQLRSDPDEIMRHLLDQRRAVLRDVPRLFLIRGNGVQGNPSDDLCVAGELLPAEQTDDRWAIQGEVIELSRSNTSP